jgi:hypothetical protein
LREPKRQFILAGDWHGHSTQALDVIFEAEKRGIDTIIQLGDFGIRQGSSRYLDKMQKYLDMFDMNLYFIDGNHEDFDRLYKKDILNDGTRYVRKNIFHLPRGYRFTWHKISFLAMGGAPSINRNKLQQNWWEQEYITDEEKKLAIEGGHADVMLMHDSPSDAPNKIVDDLELQDSSLAHYGIVDMAYCYSHREQLREITNAVNPHMLFHGHYHTYMSGKYKHKNSGKHAHIWGLDQGSGPLDKSTFVFDFFTAKYSIQSLERKDHRNG